MMRYAIMLLVCMLCFAGNCIHVQFPSHLRGHRKTKTLCRLRAAREKLTQHTASRLEVKFRPVHLPYYRTEPALMGIVLNARIPTAGVTKSATALFKHCIIVNRSSDYEL
uniref:Putative secreted protein n=1 Tax=Rhipicephalus microplus TaxID=6941 RepID=A0A6G5A3Q0_RHIMP